MNNIENKSQVYGHVRGSFCLLKLLGSVEDRAQEDPSARLEKCRSSNLA